MNIPGPILEEVRRFIEIQNEQRGPYGIGVHIEQIKGGLAKRVLLKVSVIDKDGNKMWTAASPVWMSAGSTLMLANLADAFKFTLNPSGLR